MSSENIDTIPALLKISKTKHYQDNGMVQMMFMASVVEVMELNEKSALKKPKLNKKSTL